MTGEINATRAILEVDFGSGFSSIVGQIEFIQSFNGTPIDISNKAYGDFTALLDGEVSGDSLSISGSIFYNDNAAYKSIREMRILASHARFSVIDISSLEVLSVFRGAVSALSDALEYGGGIVSSITIVSASEGTLGDAFEALGAANYWEQETGEKMLGRIESNDLLLQGADAINYRASSGVDYGLSYSSYVGGFGIFNADVNGYMFDGNLSFGWFQKTVDPNTECTLRSDSVYGAEINTDAAVGGNSSGVFNDPGANPTTYFRTPGVGLGEKLFVAVKFPIDQKYIVYTLDAAGLIAAQDVAYASPSSSHVGGEIFSVQIQKSNGSQRGHLSTPFIFNRALDLEEIEYINNAAKA